MKTFMQNYGRIAINKPDPKISKFLFKLFFGGLKQRGVQNLARQAISVTGLKIAVDNGDLDAGFLPMSQAIGLIKDLPTCEEVIERTVAEAQELVEAISKKITS